MASWAEEADSAHALAVDAVKELQAIDPSNSLLFYLIKPGEGQADPFNGDEEACRNAFKDRFWVRKKSWKEEAGVIVTTICYTNYWLAVKEKANRLKISKERER